MNEHRLHQRLRELGFREDSYFLNGSCNEAYCLKKSASGWCVYYYERGLQTGRRDFAKKSNAYEYLKTLLISDATTYRLLPERHHGHG